MNITKEIEDMKEALAKLEAKALESKKFKFKYVGNNTYLVMHYYTTEGHTGTDSVYLKHGRYRKTKANAEIALRRNKRGNRLEALYEQIGIVKEYEEGVDNYYMYNNGTNWISISASSAFYPEVVYTDKATASKACTLLNSGEVTLEGEIT